jgi:hypothetical protein
MLDSDAWAVTGILSDFGSPINLGFGGTQVAGYYSGGEVTDAASGDVFFALELQDENTVFLIQPTAAQFSPGTVTLRAINETGAAITGLAVSYTRYVRNDTARSSSFNWVWDTDPAGAFSNVLDTYNSPTTADTKGITSQLVTGVISTNLAPGAYIYLRWVTDDVTTGSSARDEFGIDDITITHLPEPQAGLLGIGLIALAMTRRRLGAGVA